MWWWGPCAGSTCCVDVVVPRRARPSALYDELVPLMTDGRRFGRRATVATDDDSDADALYALRASVSGIAVEPGIYRARDVRTHDAVALKVYDKAMLKNAVTRRRLRQEIHMIAQCEHPNILHLYGVYASKRTFQIAFELARGGEVMHRIADVCVTEREIARVIAGAASALAFMHARGLVHGEMRPEHLLYSDLEPDARVLVVDFGRAAAWRDLTFQSRVHRGQYVWDDRHGLLFLPPSVVERAPRDGVVDWPHARQVDTWSLGITMYVLLCGAFPFDGATLDDIRSQILHEPLAFPSDVPLSRAARDLLTKLLTKDPFAAPSIDEVCEHPWLSADVAADVRWGELQAKAFGEFAQRYQHAVATSSLRRPTLSDREAMSSSSSSRVLREYEVYGVAGNHEETHSSDQFEPDVRRPSFVSTDGNIQVPDDEEERLSADAYMRLASAELEALTTSSPSPQRRKPSTQSDADPLPALKSDVWPLFARQRRFFSFKSLSFRSGSSDSDDR